MDCLLLFLRKSLLYFQFLVGVNTFK